MSRKTFRAQRGRAPVPIDLFKAMNQVPRVHDNFSSEKIDTDMTGPIDAMTRHIEAASRPV
jgi:hypothetical protein